MKHLLFLLSLSIFASAFAFDKPVTPAADLPIYYASIDGKAGKQLLDAIQQVAKIGYRTEDFRYDSVWLAFQHTDMTPDNYIWEIYSDCVFEYEIDRTSNTSQTGECKGYNREHAMCQSWFSEYDLQGNKMSSSKKNSPGSDIFHIYPASYGMNSCRGNRPYGEVLKAANTSGNGTLYGAPVTTISVTNSVAGASIQGSITLYTNVLEPADEYKGDIARSYFGTMVKWAGEWAFNKNELGCTIFDASIDADTHYGPENNYGFTPYGLALMLNWHRQDPVSQKEVDRNNGIQLTQGNRNPFIDYPYLAEFIWGEMSGETLDFDQLICSADKNFILGVSNGYLGQVIDRPTDTISWMLGNTLYEQTIIYHDTRIKQLPQDPTSCSLTSTSFMGWTTTPISGTTTDAPAILYNKVSDFPAIATNTTYYAVFAESANQEVPTQTISLNKTDSTNWTLTGVKQQSNKTDGPYWLLVEGAAITSPKIKLDELESVACTMRSYQKRTTIVIGLDGTEIGTISAADNTMQLYSWIAPELTGTKSLYFTGRDGTASYGVGVKDITITLGGSAATYTNYLTHCTSGPATELENTHSPSPIANTQKILRNGQLFIQVANQLYDSLGRPIHQY